MHRNPLPILAANVHVFGPSSLLLSLVACTLKRTQAERPQPAVSHVGGPASKMSKFQSYGLVISLEPKQEYAMNANPDFCMNFHAHIRVGIHGSFFFSMTLVHSFISLPPSLPGGIPIVGLVASFGSSVDIQRKLPWQSVRRVLFYISGRCSALPSFSRL